MIIRPAGDYARKGWKYIGPTDDEDVLLEYVVQK
jgi:hypothetical protein